MIKNITIQHLYTQRFYFLYFEDKKTVKLLSYYVTQCYIFILSQQTIND